MKPTLLFALFSAGSALADQGSPIEKVMQLLSEMQTKLVKDGESEQQAYTDFSGWCKDTSREKMHEIKIATAEADELKSTIEKAESDIDDCDTKISSLSNSISAAESDLKDATEIRTYEHKEFQKTDKELAEAISMLSRAQSVLEKELGKSSFLQAGNADLQKITVALSSVVEAAGLQNQDLSHLNAFVQQASGNGDAEDDDLSADPEAYKQKSGGILETLADMQEKAEAQQSEGQKAEMNAKFNYEMLKSSLDDKLSNDGKELEDEKKAKAAADEIKATASGKLAIVSKDLAQDHASLNDVRYECMSRATEYEQEMKSRAEELKALATAKKILQGIVQSGFVQAPGFVQVGMSTRSGIKLHAQVRSQARTQMHAHSKMQVAGADAVATVRHLAEELKSTSLAQLAQRMTAALRFAHRGGADPFKKVKGMIQDMIAKLVKEAEEEAETKAFCDREMGETKKSKGLKEDEIEDLNTKIEKMQAESAKLKEEASTLSRELSDMAKNQKELDDQRREDHADFVKASGDLQQGLDAIQKALKVLRDYYAKDKEESFVQMTDGDEGQTGFDETMSQAGSSASAAEPGSAASGVIGMLEVAESDFSKNLAELTAAEETAQEEYEKITQENRVITKTKEQDVKYKTREAKYLAKKSAETENDRDGVQAELDAVLEYYEKLKPQCITKTPTFEEMKKRREKEIAGLQNALQILNGEAVFLQQNSQNQVLPQN